MPAAKKPTTKPSTAVATRKSHAVATSSYEDRLAQYATAAVKQEESVAAGAFISTRGAKFTLNGQSMGTEMTVVIVGSCMENSFYPGKFDPDNKEPPICYAFGSSEDDMSPHPEASDPQHETCKGCPHNEFGTADSGRGKACKNQRRLALLPANLEDESETLTSIQEGSFAIMKLPVTSVKGWAGYVRQLSALRKRPPLGVVTTISIEPDDKDQFHVGFTYEADLEGELLGAALDRADQVKEEFVFPYPKPSEKPPEDARKRAPAKPAARRKY